MRDTERQTIVTVKACDYQGAEKNLQLSLSWDANIDDWITAFKTVLTYMTFAEDTVKELFDPYELGYIPPPDHCDDSCDSCSCNSYAPADVSTSTPFYKEDTSASSYESLNQK